MTGARVSTTIQLCSQNWVLWFKCKLSLCRRLSHSFFFAQEMFAFNFHCVAKW